MARKHQAFFIIYLAGLLILAGTCRPSMATASPRTYRIATVAWLGWSPLHVAEEMGFWKRLGIEVQVVNYDDSTIMLEAIKAGRIDFAMDMAGSSVGVYLRGAPVVILAETNWSHGGDKIMIKTGATLKSLLGRPLGVFLNLPSCLYFLGLYLEEQGLRPDQFRIIEIGAEDLTAQFVAGRIPAMVHYEPWTSIALKKTGAKVLATSADYPGSIPECLWGYRDHLKEIPPDDIEKIIKGWVLAALWVNDPANWPRFMTILNERTFAGHTAYPEAELRAMFQNVKIHNLKQLQERNRNGGGMEAYLKNLKKFLKRNGRLSKDFPVSDIFDNRYVLKVIKGMGVN